jgi:hypothetical protein
MSSAIAKHVFITGSSEKWKAADQSEIDAFKEYIGASKTGMLGWLGKHTVAVDTAGVEWPVSPRDLSLMDIVLRLSEKNVWHACRPGHAVKLTVGPQYRGGNPPTTTFVDATAHTSTEIKPTAGGVHIVVTVVPPAAPPATPSAGFR